MSKNTAKTMTRGAMLTLLVLGAAGCATKGYVNDRIASVTGDVDGLRRETAELRNSTEEAMARAATAADSASEARQMALGRVGLEEIDSYTVYFDFNSDELKSDATATLDQAAARLNRHPEAIVDVYGFADPTGPDRYNLDLGHRRAMEVLRHLVDGTPHNLSRFAAVSFGERPLHGRTPDGDSDRQRRVVVSVLRRVPLDGTRPIEAAAVESKR
jgi:outer membrane protein OmpA-like peptidoglycan-associated protein